MVYKKYIKRNGKVYGPYYYSSRRVNGKVVSEYHGPNEKRDYKKFLVGIFGIALLIALIFFILNLNSSHQNISGNVIFGIGANYTEEENLQGIVEITLREGEFIPADSLVVFKNNNKSYEFFLRNILSESLSNGTYYLKGFSLNGSGEGYGSPSESFVYPDVYFELGILENVQQEEEEEPEALNNEEIVEKENIEGALNSSEILEENSESILENQSLESSETESIQPEEENSEEQEFQSEETELPEGEEKSEEPEETEETLNEESEPSITGNVLSNIFGMVSNFFLSLTPTGNAIKQVNSVSGQVSYDEPFILEISEGDEFELVSGSVRTDAKELPDNFLFLEENSENLVITTNYSEISFGYGENYLREEKIKLRVNLSKLNASFEPGKLNIKIVSQEKEIISLISELNFDAPFFNKTNITSENISNKSSSGLEFFVSSLTEEEKNLLLDKFGNSSIEITKAEIERNRLLVRYELGKYWIEASYGKNLSEEQLNLQMKSDREQWIKDIVLHLQETGNVSSNIQVENLLGNFSIF
jgi:hypothetical protein